ncbi:hypothetical protein, partial [Bradyrhizobium sp. 135]|uniref:hypothetical protein n=1 Tax=Bradyrhizobium sp. 135 TaxID=2782612 RepID=UPI001FF7BAB9
REMLIAAQAEQSYERLVTQWKPRRPKTGARAPQLARQNRAAWWRLQPMRHASPRGRPPTKDNPA